MKIPVREQETIIRWYRDEHEATIYTSDTTMMTRFDKFVENGDWKVFRTDRHEGDLISKTYKAPKQLLMGRPRRYTKKPTEGDSTECLNESDFPAQEADSDT